MIKHFSTLNNLMQHFENDIYEKKYTIFQKTMKYINHNFKKLKLRKLRLLN